MTVTKKPELLTKDEEYILVKNAQDGDKDALRELVHRNQGLIHKVVQRFPLKNAQVTYDDLWQQGSLGFLHAVEMFDLSLGLRLSTYAYRWVAAYVRRYFQNQGRVVRLPAHLADKKYQMDREVQKLTHELGRTPSREEIEEFVPGYNKMTERFAYTVSLNTELESGEEVMDLQVAPDNSDTILQVGSLLDILKKNVSNRDYQILIHHYGIGGAEELTYSELGDKFGITRSRTHQIVNHCIKVMKVLAD